MDISIAITTYNEGRYLDGLLKDLSLQNCPLDYEIILVEAGDYDINRAVNFLADASDKLVFIRKPKISRTDALNLIFQRAKGALIVRLDARSHVSEDYLENIFNLAMETGAENVGGVQVPIFTDEKQAVIAGIMRSPLSFGGGKSRNAEYRGYADSVYLGAFRKDKCIFGEEWFDSKHPKISEDSDLNYRIRKNGGNIFIESSIVVQHYPRETLIKFYKLCFNYGVGRGIFILKHKMFSAYRQLAPPLFFMISIGLLVLGVFYSKAAAFLAGLLATYIMITITFAITISRDIDQFKIAWLGFIGCHLFWTAGLLFSPVVYAQDLKRKT